MSRLRELLEEAYKGMAIQERVYGKFPFEIADKCGADEVSDIILSLDHLHVEKENRRLGWGFTRRYLEDAKRLFGIIGASYGKVPQANRSWFKK